MRHCKDCGTTTPEVNSVMTIDSSDIWLNVQIDGSYQDVCPICYLVNEQGIPPSLECYHCDADPEASIKQARQAGWTNIIPDLYNARANFMGCCPNCQGE